MTPAFQFRRVSAEDPPGQDGLAHFLEHLVLAAEEAEGGSAGEFGRQVAAMGGTFNALGLKNVRGILEPPADGARPGGAVGVL